jgi:hypothetical protein
MAALALEVNDVALVALRAGDAHALPPSPGLVLLDGGRLLVGAEAAAASRLQPRFVHDTYWDRLDTTPAGVPFPEGVSRADLAHAQLVAIRAAAGAGITEAYLAVPGFWSTAALGLLLSVARAAGLPVVGLVDAAVAAASLGHPGETLLHLDLTRHRSVATAMRQGTEVARERVVPAEGRGWASFEQAWAGAVAGQFVRETRFDPRHGGSSEQALHDALPGWLGELCLRQSLPAALRAGGREHTIELTRASLVAIAADLYRGLADQVNLVKRAGEPATLLLSHRAARLPGLADRLRESTGATIVELHASAAAGGALEHRDVLRHAGDALPFVVRLPSGLGAREPAAPGAPGRPATGPTRATHVIVAGIAHRIGARGLALGTSPPAGMRGLALRGDITGISRHHCTLQDGGGEVVVEDHSSGGTFVNGERVRGQAALRVGDRLRLGSPGQELLLVAVED